MRLVCVLLMFATLSAVVLSGCGGFSTDDGNDVAYTVQDLDLPADSLHSISIEEISDSGAVVGNRFVLATAPSSRALPPPDGTWSAFLWQNGSIIDISVEGNILSVTGVNDEGQVVGSVDDRAFLWENGSLEYLPALDGGDSHAQAINDLGQIAGYATASAGSAHAVLWDQGDITDLGVPAGYSWAEAHDINETGHAVGHCMSGSAQYWHAFLWKDGAALDLGTLPGGHTSRAYALNDFDQVAGHAEVSTGRYHAVMWQAGRIADLGTLPGDLDSCAADTNNSGDIVGWSFTDIDGGIPPSRACLWRSGGIIDLNTVIPPESGWRLEQAQAINHAGLIAGWGYHDDVRAAFLLTPAR